MAEKSKVEGEKTKTAGNKNCVLRLRLLIYKVFFIPSYSEVDGSGTLASLSFDKS